MVKLMTYAGGIAADAPVPLTGGVPLTPAGFAWPQCRTCQGPMQFLAQIELDDAGLLSIFMCQNDPGLCDEWDAEAGGNRAYVFPPGAWQVPAVPDGESTLLDETSAVTLVDVEADDYLKASDQWATEQAGTGAFLWQQ